MSQPRPTAAPLRAGVPLSTHQRRTLAASPPRDPMELELERLRAELARTPCILAELSAAVTRAGDVRLAFDEETRSLLEAEPPQRAPTPALPFGFRC